MDTDAAVAILDPMRLRRVCEMLGIRRLLVDLKTTIPFQVHFRDSLDLQIRGLFSSHTIRDPSSTIAVVVYRVLTVVQCSKQAANAIVMFVSMQRQCVVPVYCVK